MGGQIQSPTRYTLKLKLMSKGINLPFDDYDFETLIAPVLTLLSPGALGTLYFGFSLSAISGATIFGIQLIAIPFLASNSVLRNRGKVIEKGHFVNIMPTTRMLIYSTEPRALRSDRQQLIAKITGINVSSQPPHAVSTTNKTRAETAINTVKEQLRGDKILRRELRTYGYYRNMYSVRKCGTIVASFFALLYAIAFCYPALTTGTINSLLLGLGLFSLSLVAYWQLAITEKSFLQSAERYAEQFFKSATKLT